MLYIFTRGLTLSKVIGITGKAGAGKDTVAAIIKAYLHAYGHKAKRYSFADPLKRGCAELFGIPVEEFYDRDLKDTPHPVWGVSRRSLLIMVGTDHLRDQFDQEIWIKRANQELSKNESSNTFTIVPDVRFDNEAHFVTDVGGVLFNVVRDERLRDVPDIDHKSEAGVDLTNAITIDNNCSFRKLTHQVHILMDRVLLNVE